MEGALPRIGEQAAGKRVMLAALLVSAGLVFCAAYAYDDAPIMTEQLADAKARGPSASVTVKLPSSNDPPCFDKTGACKKVDSPHHCCSGATRRTHKPIGAHPMLVSAWSR